MRSDFKTYFTTSVPENSTLFEHNTEGSDDMLVHLKASILGNSISIPVTDGRLHLGTWQGIYFCEHRDNGEVGN